jgi:hypothetical protein
MMREKTQKQRKVLSKHAATLTEPKQPQRSPTTIIPAGGERRQADVHL